MELKNDIQVRGTLKSVDQYLNIKLDDISVVNEISYPHLVRINPFFLFWARASYISSPHLELIIPAAFKTGFLSRGNCVFEGELRREVDGESGLDSGGFE